MSNSSVPTVEFTPPTFYTLDYVVFAIFLSISGAVGIFFSIRGQKNTKEYFLGGKQMHPVPVGISAGVSFMSSGSLVGTPAEVYVNGYSYVFGAIFGSIGFFLGNVTVAYILQPLEITSVNEYLAKRYRSKLLTYTANLMVLICILQYMGACMLGSVIAFSSITGGQVSVVIGLVVGGLVGIFYTSIGGLKAVVWTDVIQSGIMVAGVITVVAKSIADTPGGFSRIIELNLDYERIHMPSWSLDMTVRHTMWGLFFGFFTYWGVWAIQPAGVQRLCATKSRRDSYIVGAIAASLFLLFSLLPFWAGINIFGYYTSRGCDVYAAGWIKNNDIILYYVRERLNLPGFQGLFVAALYAGSLSSLSSGLNSASAIVWKDTIKPLLRVQVSEAKATLISKIIVVVFGVLSMLWCYTLYSFGGMIIQVAASIDASMYGAYFSLFLLAVFFRYSNIKGAIAGLFGSFAFTLWLGVGSLMHKSTVPVQLPSVTTHCSMGNSTLEVTNSTVAAVNISATTSAPAEVEKSFLDHIYSLSYAWLTLLCICVSLLVAAIVNGCTGGSRKEVADELIFPLCRRGVCKKVRVRCLEADDTEEESEEEEKVKLPTEC